MNKKIIFVILSFVALIAIGSISYVVLSNNIDDKPLVDEDVNKDSEEKEDKKPPKEKKDSIVFKKTKKSGNKIISTFDLTMNNEEAEFDIEFTYEENESYNEIKASVLGLDIYRLGTDEALETTFTEANMKKAVTEENFIFIKGEDKKTYLGVVSNIDSFVSGKTSVLYIFNDKFDMLTDDIDNLGCGGTSYFTINTLTTGYVGSIEPFKSGYEDTLGVCENSPNCHVNVKIEDDKIYSLFAKDINGFAGTLEERIYTIKDNKFNYTVKSTDTISSVFGQAC